MMRSAFLFLVLAAALRADVLTLTSGLKVEGIVVERGDKVDVQVPEGLFSYRRDVVQKIERKASALQQYRDARARVNPKDAEALYQLGLWCASRGMPVPAAQEFERATRANPHHVGAHQRLGHVQDGELWYSESDYQSHLGNVRLDGQWLSRDVAAARGELRQMESEARFTAVRAYYERLARQEAAQGADPSSCGGSAKAGPWLNDMLWAPGQRIRCVFADGTPEQQAEVARCASEWCQYASVTFDFAPAGADTSLDDVRITFQGTGAHSMIGRSSVAYARAGQATIVLNQATHGANPRAWRRTILHEFGHALGLLHEHQNPRAKIKWNEQAVTAYLARSGMDEQQTRENVLTTAGGDGKDFDPASIMLYALPREATQDGMVFSYNTDLSPMDKEVIASLYPGRDGPVPARATPAVAPVDNRDLSRLSGALAALRRDAAGVRAMFAKPVERGTRAEADQEQRLKGLEDATRMLHVSFMRRASAQTRIDQQRAAGLSALSKGLFAFVNEVLAIRRVR